MTQHPDPIVTIAPGRVRGVWREGSAAFLGIPFAQAPVGELRFAAPVPPGPWDGVRDALEYGATAKREKPGEVTLIPEPAVAGDSTLNVNVFTPAPGDARGRAPRSRLHPRRRLHRGLPRESLVRRRGVQPRRGRDRDDLVPARVRRVRPHRRSPEQPRRARLARRARVGAREHRRVRRRPRPGHDRRAVRRRRRGADAARDAGCPGSLPRGLGAVTRARGRAGRAGAHALREAREPRRRRTDARRIRRRPRDDARSSLQEAGGNARLEESARRDPCPARGRTHVGTDDRRRPDSAPDARVDPRGRRARHPARARRDRRRVHDGRPTASRTSCGSSPSRSRSAGSSSTPPTRKAYLAANGPQRRKGTAAVLGRYATDAIFRVGVVRVAEARAGCRDLGVPVRVAVAGRSAGPATASTCRSGSTA